MITHVVLLQPKVSTSIEELITFLEHVQASRAYPRNLILSVGENRSSSMEGLRMVSLCASLMKLIYMHIIVIQHMLPW